MDVDRLLSKAVSGTPGHLENMIQRINSRAIFAKHEEYPMLAKKLRRIMDVMRSHESFCQEEAEGLMLAFLAEIARQNDSESEKNGKYWGGVKSDELIFRILDYISEHYSEDLKVSDIAEWTHISETHFRRIFTSYMNMSPLDYINQLRIRAACEYLKKTDESVAMIAAKCGFPVSSTFNRNFRHIMGVSPAEWRRRPENYEQQILKFQIHSEEGW